MRQNGYAPIEDYAVIGDGRTAALVSRDGSVDWLCLPDFESPSVFGRLLDADRGGYFSLGPAAEFVADRRYLDGTNVLETTFRTSSGRVRVTDALTVGDSTALTPLRELVRRVEGLEGHVELSWRCEPRFEYGQRRPKIARRDGRFIATAGANALAVCSWAGDANLRNDGIEGRFAVASGETATFAIPFAHGEPLVLPSRDDAEHRLEETTAFWERWSSTIDYGGPWEEGVVRSALALKLLVFAPSGAIVAAPTTSIPEWIGGARNWDYRYTWVRDASLTLTTLHRLGYSDEAHAFFWWLSHATALTHPEIRVMYRLSGGAHLDEREIESLSGYRESRPVRIGNDAHLQVQLDVYGPMLEAISMHARRNGRLDAAEARRIAAIVDWIAKNWSERDAGIWERRGSPTQFIQSKAMCWVALDRACALAEARLLPDRTVLWRAAANAIKEFIDDHGWDAHRQSYVRAIDIRELDASLLTLVLFGYDDATGNRARATVAAVERELRDGPLVYRYRDDGAEGAEGAFLACSFWLVSALAKTGRVPAGAALMDELTRLANDVGLYSEEVAPDGSFLGNFPQALTHLALIEAALAIRDAEAAA